MLWNLAALALGDLAGTASPPPAYLDPGGGGVVLQFALAGMLSAIYFARTTLARLRGWAVRRAGR